MIGLIDCRSKSNRPIWARAGVEQMEFFDRPLLQHAVEQMVQLGVRHCVLITESPETPMHRWGKGAHWGCALTAIQPAGVTGLLALMENAPVLVGRGDCIPRIEPELLSNCSNGKARLVYHESIENGVPVRSFTGWGVASPQVLLRSCFATYGADGLQESMQHSAETAIVGVHVCIRTNSPVHWLQSQRIVLEGRFPELVLHAEEVRRGLQIGRRVHVHPASSISGAAFLGDNVRVCRGAKLSGHVVISRDSVVGPGVHLHDTCVQPGTYLGRNLRLTGEIVLPDSIVQAEQGISRRVADPARLARTDIGLFQYGRLLWSALRPGS